MAAAVLELKARAGDKVTDSTGDEDFTGASEVHDPSGGMHGYATNVTLSELDLSSCEGRNALRSQVVAVCR